MFLRKPLCRVLKRRKANLAGRMLLLGCSVLLIFPMATISAEKTMPGQQKSGKFDLSGHRGARGLCPENTLPAFAKALAIGVTTLEMDAAVTKDGVVVISHDPVLNPDITRGPDGKWIGGERKLIKALTFAELRGYDVGRIRKETEHYRSFPEQAPVDGTRIPSLSAVIELVRASRQDEVLLSIEAKFDPTDESKPTWEADELAKAIVEVLRKEKFAHRANIQSFDWAILQTVQQLAPEIRTVYLTSAQPGDDTLGIGKTGGSKWTGKFDVNAYNGSAPHAINAAGGKLWSPDSRDLDSAQVKTAHELGISVIVWTVNEPTEMAHFIDLGVDGIITDYPDRLRQVLKDKGMPLPKLAGRVGSGVKCKVLSFFKTRR